MNTQRCLLRIAVVLCVAIGWTASTAGASSATLVAVYQDCRYVTGSVFLEAPGLSSEDKSGAVAAVESAIVRYGFEDALPHVSRMLRRYGVEYIKIDRRGHEGCVDRSTGRFVQVTGSYCGDQLVRAELYVDGKLVTEKSGDISSLDAFVDSSLVELRRRGIWDRPRVEISSEGNCEQGEAPKSS